MQKSKIEIKCMAKIKKLLSDKIDSDYFFDDVFVPAAEFECQQHLNYERLNQVYDEIEHLIKSEIELKIKQSNLGVTIQEAIKSGKPFRRISWMSGYWMKYRKFDKTTYCVEVPKGEDKLIGRKTTIKVEDAIATDWEVKDEKESEGK